MLHEMGVLLIVKQLTLSTSWKYGGPEYVTSCSSYGLQPKGNVFFVLICIYPTLPSTALTLPSISTQIRVTNFPIFWHLLYVIV
jgi:hypothetical protein